MTRFDIGDGFRLMLGAFMALVVLAVLVGVAALAVMAILVGVQQ